MEISKFSPQRHRLTEGWISGVSPISVNHAEPNYRQVAEPEHQRSRFLGSSTPAIQNRDCRGPRVLFASWKRRLLLTDRRNDKSSILSVSLCLGWIRSKRRPRVVS